MRLCPLAVVLTTVAICQGSLVEFPGNCFSSPCKNNGICHELTKETVRCFCPFGYAGVLCERRHCVCLNGGRCAFNGSQRFCICPSGYCGQSCEHECSEITAKGVEKLKVQERNCTSGWCLNSGDCADDDREEVGCECRTGFTGRRCETKLNDPEPSPCESGAECVNAANGLESNHEAGVNDEHERQKHCSVNNCLNGGTCLRSQSSYRCICQKEFSGKNCEDRIDFGQYEHEDASERDLCAQNQCETKAADGNCDRECNYYACGYDGGDCSANTEPFSRCPTASFCAHSFHDQKCDELCNTEECLFDGHDCDSSDEVCDEKQFCAETHGNEVCDVRCNSSACGWDGGDCRPAREPTTNLDDEVTLVLAISKEELLKKLQSFLLTLGQRLRALVRVKREGDKPMIYDWESEEAKTLMNRSRAVFHGALEQWHLTAAGHKAATTVVVLTVDVSVCKADGQGACFANATSVANYLGAATSKQILNDLDAPIFAAFANSSYKTESGISARLFGTGGTFLAFIIVVSIVVPYKCRGKRIRAPIWHPPAAMTDNCKRTSSVMQSSFDYGEFALPKRMHLQPESDVPSRPSSIADSFRSEGSQWTIVHDQAVSESSIGMPVERSLVNVPDGYGRTPLMLLPANPLKEDGAVAADVGNLLDAGADINFRDKCGSTVLMIAVKRRRPDLVAFLLKHGADPNLADSGGRTALHFAVAECYEELVAAVLKSNADVNAWDANNRTALTYSARYTYSPDIATLLLEAKADPQCTGDCLSLTYDGRTPLHYAAQLDNLDVLQVLISHGVDKNIRDSQEKTPLFLAAQEGKIRAVRLLLGFGAKADIRDQLGRLPRDVAAERHYHEVVALLDKKNSSRVSRATYSGRLSDRKRHSRKTTSVCSIPKTVTQSSPPERAVAPDLAPVFVTPPFSDESNFGMTPSPSRFCGNTQPHSLPYAPPVMQGTLPKLLPQCGAYDGYQWRPQGDCMTQNTTSFPNGVYGYDEQQFLDDGGYFAAPDDCQNADSAYDQGHFYSPKDLRSSHEYNYPQLQYPTGSCNV